MTHVVDRHALIGGHRIAYGVYGAGEPVVVHGTPSSSYIWRDIVPRLVDAGYRAHVFDLLGYGLSERPRDPAVDTSITGNEAILNDLLEEWGLDTFHLVAHDIGGGVAQRFGVHGAERLRTLTMIDVVSLDSYPSERTRKQQAIPGSALRVIENCGHFAPEERPGEVAAAILGFLRQHCS